MALPEEEVRDLLQTGGFLGPWVDLRGNSQPTPVVQVGMLIESEIGNNRCIVIRKGGGGIADEWLRVPQITIYLIGFVSDAHLILAERADQMLEYLLDNYQSGRTIGVTTQSDVNGPFLFDSGRPAYEINLQTIIAR